MVSSDASDDSFAWPPDGARMRAPGNGVRANSIHPGHIATPLSAPAYANPQVVERLMADVPLGRIGEAVEIADAILFLAGGQSRYTTGAELIVDGGTTAQ